MSFSSALPTATRIGFLVVILYAYIFPAKRSDVHTFSGWSFSTVWPFFNRRFDFLRERFGQMGDDMFTFNVWQYPVTAMRGEEGRKKFFLNKGMGIMKGYQIFMGGAPRLTNFDVSEEDLRVNWFNKHISHVLNKERVSEVLPSLFDSLQTRMETWGMEGQIDPFKKVYDLVFQMTVRMGSCRELADDKAAMDQLQADYSTLEKCATPTALLLPWFPSKARMDQLITTIKLYIRLRGYVNARRSAEVPSSDTIDYLLSQGMGTTEIVEFVFGITFSGVVGTGINSCWLLFFLCFHKDWKARVMSEVQALIEKHTNTSSSEPIHQRLAAIPVSVWEEEMPVTEIVLRETVRLVSNSTLLRRNNIGDVHVAGKTIPKDNYVAYPAWDVHMNPEIYEEPLKFDPDRFGPGREEDKKHAFGYLGWGAGRYPCPGMKVSKLEVKMIVAFLFAAYEFDLVNAAGNFPDSLPKIDYNNIHQVGPLGDPCFLKFKRVVQ